MPSHSGTRRCLLASLGAGIAVLGALPAAGQVIINDDLKLLASDGAADDLFGLSIAIDNGVVAVGAISDDDNGSDSGSAYLFDASTGAQLFKLLPSDGAAGDEFSRSIAINNGVVAVGSRGDDDNGSDSGSAYLFDASTGAQLFKLLPSDGAAGDRFGWSIAINNGVVAVGADADFDNGPGSGSAYLFDASTGEQLLKLLPSDGGPWQHFGQSIAIDNGIVAVGARGNDNGTSAGSAYLFDASTGAQLFKLLPGDGAANDLFGHSIAIDNGVVAVGAYQDDDHGSNSGSAYLFDASTGTQLFKLLPGDGADGNYFGRSIAIDSGVVAVGANFDDDNGTNSGSAYLFDASTGTQLSKLLPSDGAERDRFGWPIAIDNGVVAVGTYQDDDNGTSSGSAYLFDASTAQQSKLLASDGAADDLFGFSIATDNGVVAVGARDDDDNGADSGSAYLFDASGAQLFKLLPSDGAAGDEFGFSIAIDSGVVAVGAIFDDDNGSDSGSAYLFDASTGTQLYKLLPSDGAAGDEFGFSIAINSGVIAVGVRDNDDNGSDSGSAYLFDASTGTQLFKLLPSDGAAGDKFGRSIAIHNGVVAVGAYFDDDNGAQSGSAYLFDASTGELLLKLLPSDGAAFDQFGTSIAIHNGVVAVGARDDNDNGSDSGSAYLFDASTGTQLLKLLPADGAANDQFGTSIAIANGVVAVAANLDDDNGSQSGSVYLFDASTGTQLSKLPPSDGAAGDEFGRSIAIGSGVVAVGADGDDNNSGSAYVFSVPQLECLADVNHDGFVTPTDFTAWINAFNNQLPECDQNSDGSCTPTDFTAWIANFNAGC
jgi:hypothetical protein